MLRLVPYSGFNRRAANLPAGRQPDKFVWAGSKLPVSPFIARMVGTNPQVMVSKLQMPFSARVALRSVCRAVLWLLVAYWVTFFGYTIKNLIAGGPGAVVAWYKHISHTEAVSLRWDWRVFLAQQIGMLAITWMLWFFGQRIPQHNRPSVR